MPTAPKVTYQTTQRSSTASYPNEMSTTSYRPVRERVVHPGNRKERRKELSGKRNKRRALDDNREQNTIYNAFRGY